MFLFPCVEELFKISQWKYFYYISHFPQPTAYSTFIPFQAAAFSTVPLSVLRGASMPTHSLFFCMRCYSQISLGSLDSFLDCRYSSNRALDLCWFNIFPNLMVHLVHWYKPRQAASTNCNCISHEGGKYQVDLENPQEGQLPVQTLWTTIYPW